ncbi:MAG: penicillin-binding protein 2 [Verrucomicrobiota bacterium]
MAKAVQFRRLLALALLLLAGLACLGFRLVDLQVFRHDELRAQARRNTQRVIAREPLRGQIRDIRGVPLATSVQAKIVCADPKLIGDRWMEMARVLSPLLKMDENVLAQKLQPRIIRYQTNGEPIFAQFVLLKNKVKVEEWEQIQQTLAKQSFGMDEKILNKAQQTVLKNLRQKAVFTEEDQLRVYPHQSLAAHVLGYVGAGDKGEVVGRNGIELSMEKQLSGVPGWRRTEIDSRRREILAYRDGDVEARDGRNVVLTIDAALQNIVETELADAMRAHTPISASAIMVRPRTGEILAMATLPNFDPNRPGAFSMDSLRNRVISDLAEPGSTFKIVVVSSALNEGVVKLTDQFHCENGRFLYAGRVLHDHESYGILSVEEIITKSSNIGSAKIGIKMGDNKLYDYICKFGFGVRTGLPLGGEIRGIVYSPKDKLNWTKITIAQIPMGHGIAVTPLQMVMAMSAIANDGRLMCPMLIDRLEDDAGNVITKFPPQVVREVVSSNAARQMVKALKTVVTDDGTAAKARLDHYTVAGKTGTAQKAERGVYVQGKFFSSFIGFFPADNPELCISIVLDEPKQGHYGGQTAAPFFKNIAERAANYLNLKPDIFPEDPEAKTTLAARK